MSDKTIVGIDVAKNTLEVFIDTTGQLLHLENSASGVHELQKALTRSILRQYKTLINERRRESGLSPVTTAKVLDEICESATRQCAVYLCGHFILQGGQGDGK